MPVNDLYAAAVQAGLGRFQKPDGVHFTPEGSELLGAAVARSVRSV